MNTDSLSPEEPRRAKRRAYYLANRNKWRGYHRNRTAAAKERKAKKDAEWTKKTWNEPRRVAKRATTKRRYYDRSKAKWRPYHSAYHARNAVARRQRVAHWKRSNPDQVRAQIYRRRALKLNRLHPMHDVEVEIAMFAEIRRLNAETGVRHHLDHIIALSVGGWHHHSNLQILPQKLNEQKHGDPFWEKPGFKSWRDVPDWLWPEKLVPAYRALLEQPLAEIIPMSA